MRTASAVLLLLTLAGAARDGGVALPDGDSQGRGEGRYWSRAVGERYPAGQPSLPITGADSARKGLSFVVMGHIRGRDKGLNPLLAEELDEARRLHPDLAFITGDQIWGDYERIPSDSAVVDSEWTQLDSALATLGVPVYRVPGNHDLHDLVTRNAWIRRYGTLPRAITVGRVRFLLLSTMVFPKDGDTTRDVSLRDLDAAQVAFLRTQLADTAAFDHAFVFFHHLLWWAPDSAAWWREVHPLLRAGRVRAVFTGDLGPLKFSHLERDGVHYYQSTIETQPSLEILRVNDLSRLISAQLDNFLYVTTAGGDVRVEVRTVGAESSGRFTPQRYRDVYEAPPTLETRRRRLREAVGSLRRFTIVMAGSLAASFVLGVGAGLWWRSRTASRGA